MRRKDREITDFNIILQVIDKCEVLRIGLADDDLFPYIVPVNFAYAVEGKEICFYIHGAMAGRKYELMQKNGVCSFEMDCDHELVVKEDEGEATMYYKSVMGRAKVELLEGEEKVKGLDLIMARDAHTRTLDYNRAPLPRTAVAKLTVLEYSGKANPPVKTE